MVYDVTNHALPYLNKDQSDLIPCMRIHAAAFRSFFCSYKKTQLIFVSYPSNRARQQMHNNLSSLEVPPSRAGLQVTFSRAMLRSDQASCSTSGRRVSASRRVEGPGTWWYRTAIPTSARKISIVAGSLSALEYRPAPANFFAAATNCVFS